MYKVIHPTITHGTIASPLFILPVNKPSINENYLLPTKSTTWTRKPSILYYLPALLPPTIQLRICHSQTVILSSYL